MLTTITVPDGYRNVVYIAAGIIPLFSFIQGFIVTYWRPKAKILYPNHYATPQQAKENPVAYRFNCMQRAHGQYLENMPQTIIMMLIAGLEFPKETVWLGCGWLACRLAYWTGYVFSSASDGNGRLYGTPFWFMQGGIWFLSLLTAARKT